MLACGVEHMNLIFICVEHRCVCLPGPASRAGSTGTLVRLLCCAPSPSRPYQWHTGAAKMRECAEYVWIPPGPASLPSQGRVGTPGPRSTRDQWQPLKAKSLPCWTRSTPSFAPPDGGRWAGAGLLLLLPCVRGAGAGLLLLLPYWTRSTPSFAPPDHRGACAELELDCGC